MTLNIVLVQALSSEVVSWRGGHKVNHWVNLHTYKLYYMQHVAQIETVACAEYQAGTVFSRQGA